MVKAVEQAADILARMGQGAGALVGPAAGRAA